MDFKMPTEEVQLPSKGLLYPKDSPLSKGKIEMKYMTAREEDILTNASYIADGTVLDRMLKSLVVTDGIDINELLIGDKNALLIASRVLGYGKDYKFTYSGIPVEVDLTTLGEKKFDESLFKSGENEFEFNLPHTKNRITFKLLTGKDETNISKELEGLKKLDATSSPELTTRLKYMITSVEGSREQKDIRDFIDKYLLARDSKALRDYIREIQPDIDLSFTPKGTNTKIDIPINLSFFWPDA